MIIQPHLKDASHVISSHGIADVYFNNISNHHSLVATAAFRPGETVVDFHPATTLNYPTYLTVQVGSNTHITLAPAFLQYINHSCDPNVFFDTTAMQLVCTRPIEPGDQFCFFYPSAEWKMAQPFVCSCGSNNCLQLINGAAYLSEETLNKYRLTDFIKQQVNYNQ